jgi:DNA-binding beta-propeller fold protein YncE
MTRPFLHAAALAVFALCGACTASEPHWPETLAITADIALPGDTSRFDYESLDAARHRLFIAHLGAGEVLVFDTQTRRVVARIAGVGGVHGVLVVPELDRVYASATATDEVVAIDADSLAITARMPGGRYPDGMAYAPAVRKLYVSDETGATETVIDAVANRRIATIALGGEAGNSQYDSGSGHVFVNVQSRAELVEIDPASDTIVARISLPGAKGNHGLLIDAAGRRAFVACEDNDTLLVVDLRSRTVLASFAVGHAPDVLALDPALGRVVVASESGIAAVLDARHAPVAKVFEGFVGANAHAVAIDPRTHLAYFPLRDAGGHPVLRVARLRP